MGNSTKTDVPKIDVPKTDVPKTIVSEESSGFAMETVQGLHISFGHILRVRLFCLHHGIST